MPRLQQSFTSKSDGDMHVVGVGKGPCALVTRTKELGVSKIA